MKKLTLLWGFLTLFFNHASAQQYYVIFFAYPKDFIVDGEPSRAGHAFVSFIKKDYTTGQTILEGKWGFHPMKQSFKALFKEEGVIHTERGTPSESDFVVEIKDVKVYEQCKRLKQIWDSKNYSAIAGQTCVDFARDVAYRIPGVVIPSSLGNTDKWQWPKDFMLALKALNYKNDTESRKSLSESTGLSEVEDFKIFIKKFSKDEAFQISRIKFPIRWTEITEHNSIRNKVYQHTFTKSDWKSIDLTVPTKRYSFLDEIYPPSPNYPSRGIVEMYLCEGCGSGLQYIFTLQGGKWYLKEVHWFFV